MFVTAVPANLYWYHKYKYNPRCPEVLLSRLTELYVMQSKALGESSFAGHCLLIFERFLPSKNQGRSLGRIRPQPWLIETMSYHVKPAKRVALINIYVIGCRKA